MKIKKQLIKLYKNTIGRINNSRIKNKNLTSVRSAATDVAVSVKPHRVLTLEEALEFIEDDELVEVTPDAIRLRKKYLTKMDRKLAHRS